MCTNTSIYLAMKMKFISLMVRAVGFYRGVSSQKLQVVKKCLRSCDVTAVSVVIEAIVCVCVCVCVY